MLGEASDPLELFEVDECDDNELIAFHSKVQVHSILIVIDD